MATPLWDHTDEHGTRRPPEAATRGRPLIVVSNRGPAEFVVAEDGSLTTRTGSGGLVTALTGCLNALHGLDVTWVAVAMTEGDHRAFAQPGAAHTLSLDGQSVRLRYVPVPREAYHRHYEVVSNQVLWFLQHYLWSPEFMPPFDERLRRDWATGYRAVNLALAEAAADEARRRQRDAGLPPVILVQDYQLYLVPGAVRRLFPEAVLIDFVHIPWPSLHYWQFLPHEQLLEIYDSLVHNDLVGFQTRQDLYNFAEAARVVLDGASVSLDRAEVEWRGQGLRLGVYPVALDVADTRRSAAAAARGVRGPRPDAVKTVVRSDRLEPTKNIVTGFLAFRRLLRDHPELKGRVRFRAFLVPSRQGVPAYQRERREILRVVRDVNRRYRTAGCTPIELVLANDRPRALAALREADVVLINPTMDGMNLVAEEAAVVNERDGVLVLSRNAGVYRQLRDACLPVTPTDVVETADQLYRALTLDRAERHALADRARAVVEARTPAEWLIAQLADALSAAGGERRDAGRAHGAVGRATGKRNGRRSA